MMKEVKAGHISIAMVVVKSSKCVVNIYCNNLINITEIKDWGFIFYV